MVLTSWYMAYAMIAAPEAIDTAHDRQEDGDEVGRSAPSNETQAQPGVNTAGKRLCN
ncbi:hypothetical protein D3C87_2113810 [compost metagenome]